jgi:hypothetical protein
MSPTPNNLRNSQLHKMEGFNKMSQLIFFPVPPATMCFNTCSLHIPSLNNHFSGGETHRAEFGALEFRGKISKWFGTEQNYRLGRGYRDGAGDSTTLHTAGLKKC